MDMWAWARRWAQNWTKPRARSTAAARLVPTDPSPITSPTSSSRDPVIATLQPPLFPCERVRKARRRNRDRFFISRRLGRKMTANQARTKAVMAAAAAPKWTR